MPAPAVDRGPAPFDRGADAAASPAPEPAQVRVPEQRPDQVSDDTADRPAVKRISDVEAEGVAGHAAAEPPAGAQVGESWRDKLGGWRTSALIRARGGGLGGWRRYALGAGCVVVALGALWLGSKVGQYPPGPGSGTVPNNVASQPSVKTSRSQPVPNKPSTLALNQSRSPSTPAGTQPNTAARQPTTGSRPAAPPAPAVKVPNVPSVPPAGESASGSVVRQIMPNVPKKASNTIHGTVRVGVRVSVDAAGNVTAASLDSPGPSKYFARLSLEAARNWKFSPPKKNSADVASVWILHFGYRNNGAGAQPSQIQP